MSTPILYIEDAKYIENHKIYLKFNDGKENILDFQDFIFNSQHPDIQKYKDINRFKDFHLDHGDIEWNDYELAFPVYDLYRNKI